jgi:sugar/nucleoside kinase (ribokinase family)
MSDVLLGQVCLDIYTRTGRVVPGCGILHNACHLQRAGNNSLLITRIGRENSRELWQFFEHNHIRVLPDLVEETGQSASIEVAVTDSGEAIISNPVDGVWRNFRLNPAEAKLADPLVSADFLDLRDFTPESIARFLPAVDIAFIGWKGDPADSFINEIERLARAHNTMIVVTMGSRGIWLFDALLPAAFQRQWVPVESVPVRENTNGCGDAFIGWFLAEYWRSGNREQAIARGKIGGRQATTWRLALPDDAYPP